MSMLVYCNIGNSDLTADGQRPKLPRPDGSALWQGFAAHRFTLPIIEPCLQSLFDHGLEIGRLVLFYTDQPENAQTNAPDRYGVSLRDKDTLWYANIAERLLRERFGARIASIDRVQVERGDGQAINPSLYDEAFDAYGALIARTYVPALTTCYVLMAGGIPACNIALQIQSLSAYGERCRFLYQPEGGQPYELRVGVQMQATFRRAAALEALAQYDFVAALRNVETLQLANTGLIALLRYACYREAFDFVRARVALADGLLQASGELRTFLATLQPDLLRLAERADTAMLLQEVYASAHMSFINGRYADFLGRVFRFQEAALRHLVESRLSLPTDMSPAVKDVNLAGFLQGIAESPALQAHLDAARIDGRPLRYSDGPNRPVMISIIEFITKGGGRSDGTPYLTTADQGRFVGLKKAMDKMSSLAELRNQSIIAHGYAGVSREELDRVYTGDAAGIIADMEKVITLSGIGQPRSPFAQIAEMAIQQLRRAT